MGMYYPPKEANQIKPKFREELLIEWRGLTFDTNKFKRVLFLRKLKNSEEEHKE